MTTNFNNLTCSESERLAILIEECSEVQKTATKILRHGYESYNPDDTGAGSNRTQLEQELGDLLAIIMRMDTGKDINWNKAIERMIQKYRDVRYLHHQYSDNFIPEISNPSFIKSQN